VCNVGDEAADGCFFLRLIVHSAFLRLAR
jgi:hypothetical protein